jgi:hypothetical protein
VGGAPLSRPSPLSPAEAWALPARGMLLEDCSPVEAAGDTGGMDSDEPMGTALAATPICESDDLELEARPSCGGDPVVEPLEDVHASRGNRSREPSE